jgi:hypothetical protein
MKSGKGEGGREKGVKRTAFTLPPSPFSLLHSVSFKEKQ